jgi:hypothetical protein
MRIDERRRPSASSAGVALNMGDITDTFADITLLRDTDHRAAGTVVDFHDAVGARAFLGPLASELRNERELRRALREVDPFSDMMGLPTADIVERVAQLVAGGRLVVVVRRRGPGGGQAPGTSSASAAPTSSATSSSSTTAATAATTTAAASTSADPPPASASAVAAAQAAAAASADFATADSDVQAAALQQAAADGTPFCEECEKARAARDARLAAAAS